MIRKNLDNIQIAIGKVNEHGNFHGIQHAVNLKFHPFERYAKSFNFQEFY